MYISQQLKKQNIAEYLLYMWQVEDLIRANNFDMEKIRETIVNSYPVDEEHKKALAQWYEDLIAMMHDEGVMEKGHIQINRNVIIWLTDLHLRLLRSPKFLITVRLITKRFRLLLNCVQRGQIRMLLK